MKPYKQTYRWRHVPPLLKFRGDRLMHWHVAQIVKRHPRLVTAPFQRILRDALIMSKRYGLRRVATEHRVHVPVTVHTAGGSTGMIWHYDRQTDNLPITCNAPGGIS